MRILLIAPPYALNVAIYGVLLSVTVVLFFVSLWSTHSAMVRAKRTELSMARENLGAALREAQEWPYNATVLLRLGASALFPTAVYLLKFLFGVRITP